MDGGSLTFAGMDAGTRQVRRQVRLHRARAHARAATAVRNAEGLVQVEVRHVRAPLAGLGDADQGIHVGAVGIDLAAMRMHRFADRHHVSSNTPWVDG